jgi:hypothetical protein
MQEKRTDYHTFCDGGNVVWYMLTCNIYTFNAYINRVLFFCSISFFLKWFSENHFKCAKRITWTISVHYIVIISTKYVPHELYDSNKFCKNHFTNTWFNQSIMTSFYVSLNLFEKFGSIKHKTYLLWPLISTHLTLSNIHVYSLHIRGTFKCL